ncbi:hypothetical protein ACFVP0_09960 [Streptomyces cinereoruber]|uniref:hypothetical protein n=1 Tax=Streptomyces cinereoruber TaxID=67260 RepID=UPI0036B74CC1
MAGPGTTDQETILQHPDFELYDNVGLTSEQVAATHFGASTEQDLLRWARRDAETFLAEHPLPAEPVLDLDAYTVALAAATTPAELSAVTQHLLDAVRPALAGVSQLFDDIARRDDRYRRAKPGTPPDLLKKAASHIWSSLYRAYEADLLALRAEYDPPPAPSPKDAPRLPPAPPAPPSAGPAPGR